RHLADRGDQVAILFEPNDPSQGNISYTYKELHAAVCKTANALKANGIEKGDRVCFYMPMVPELAIAVLPALASVPFTPWFLRLLRPSPG
ncbi:AMP-binding protein, partial [Okeania hirsuta]|uniref:AMP-binding protein n=1 Tax=Okeania hirsuta TaxID=1458930 RepID=UPI001960E72C